ncbi:pyridoxamine 5'-phosphate oxidase family protein [Paenibacillus sp. RUD330]|uniref:pyridoxamine 5'-phosphate oxidase family protein n=1 Tax=Paenibacillus sp. RUD330 TaxID=2023772 RepID=UPI000B9265F7|nr:pyridoxamine 5'-phosphate oxidase family protein [Paenibacillus sp. RUD330]ASS67609.1 pyridoxamine 5'-phosphate oxidase family protein [Paenibacillus sp. RUD330]
MSNEYTASQEAVEKVRDLIKGIDIAMLTTATDEGLVSRPMQTQEVEFDGDLWFITKKETDKFEELQHDRRVNVAYVGKSYVSVRGEAELVSDRSKIKEIWNPTYEKLLGMSSDDPELVLIKVKAETAEYWETGNKAKMVAQLFKKMTGKQEHMDMNKTVELNGRKAEG